MPVETVAPPVTLNKEEILRYSRHLIMPEVGMEGQLARRHGVLGEGVVEQRLEQGGALGIGDAPADNPAAEDIEDDVEIEVGPFRRSRQLCYIPGPDLIGAFGEQFGLGVDRVAQLIAAFPDFVVGVQDPVQGPD